MTDIWKKHTSAHKTQLCFPPNAIASLQYFQYVLCKEIQYIEYWHRYQHRSITRYEKTIWLHWRQLEITAINDRSKFKIKDIKELVFLTWMSQFLLIANEFLRFVNSQLRMPIQGASLSSQFRWQRKAKHVKSSVDTKTMLYRLGIWLARKR